MSREKTEFRAGTCGNSDGFKKKIICKIFLHWIFNHSSGRKFCSLYAAILAIQNGTKRAANVAFASVPKRSLVFIYKCWNIRTLYYRFRSLANAAFAVRFVQLRMARKPEICNCTFFFKITITIIIPNTSKNCNYNYNYLIIT